MKPRRETSPRSGACTRACASVVCSFFADSFSWLSAAGVDSFVSATVQTIGLKPPGESAGRPRPVLLRSEPGSDQVDSPHGSRSPAAAWSGWTKGVKSREGTDGAPVLDTRRDPPRGAHRHLRNASGGLVGPRLGFRARSIASGTGDGKRFSASGSPSPRGMRASGFASATCFRGAVRISCRSRLPGRRARSGPLPEARGPRRREATPDAPASPRRSCRRAPSRPAPASG